MSNYKAIEIENQPYAYMLSSYNTKGNILQGRLTSNDQAPTLKVISTLFWTSHHTYILFT